MKIYSKKESCCSVKSFIRGSITFLICMLISVSSRAYTDETISQNKNPKNESTKILFHQGVKRIYHIYLPQNFDKNKPAPMVLALHGGGGKGSKFETGTTNGTLTAAADKLGVVLVFPEGINKHWNDGRTEIFKKKRAYDDVGFIEKVIDRMIKEYGIDAARVYATGISNGGLLSVRLAIDLSDKIAAVAPVAAQLTKALERKSPTTPISIMIVNGTSDPLIPFKGGHIKLFKFSRSRGEVLSTYTTINHFKKYNSCTGGVKKDETIDNDSNDGTTVTIEKYACKNNTEVILVQVNGGGHTWPGGKQYLKPRIVGSVSREINASEMILNFFLKHSLN